MTGTEPVMPRPPPANQPLMCPSLGVTFTVAANATSLSLFLSRKCLHSLKSRDHRKMSPSHTHQPDPTIRRILPRFPLLLVFSLLEYFKAKRRCHVISPPRTSVASLTNLTFLYKISANSLSCLTGFLTIS